MDTEINNHLVNIIHEGIEWISLGLEVIAVVVIFTGVIMVIISRGMLRIIFKTIKPNQPFDDGYENYKKHLGRSLLLGLEFLVAADVIRTVALSPTIENVLTLGVLIVIRTFLSWSLVVEMDGHWPWKSSKKEEKK